MRFQVERIEWNDDCSSVDFHREEPISKIIFERLLMEDIEKSIPIVYKKLELFDRDEVKDTGIESVNKSILFH